MGNERVERPACARGNNRPPSFWLAVAPRCGSKNVANAIGDDLPTYLMGTDHMFPKIRKAMWPALPPTLINDTSSASSSPRSARIPSLLARGILSSLRF